MSNDSSAEHLCWASALVVSARMGVKDNVGAWGLSARNKKVIEEWNVHDTLCTVKTALLKLLVSITFKVQPSGVKSGKWFQGIRLPMDQMRKSFETFFWNHNQNWPVSCTVNSTNYVLYFICQSCWTLEITQNLATKIKKSKYQNIKISKNQKQKWQHQI